MTQQQFRCDEKGKWRGVAHGPRAFAHMFSRSLLRPLSEALAEYILSADPDHEDEIRSNEIPQICLLLRIILHGQDYLRRSDVGCRVRRLLQDCCKCFSEESSRKKKGERMRADAVTAVAASYKLRPLSNKFYGSWPTPP